MLTELKVSQFALIDNIHIHFQNGFNILSGETGAGKSILLKSLALLMGDKASADMIRTGAHQATIEGSFDLTHRPDITTLLNQLGIESEDAKLIVRRIIDRNSHSKVYLNGSINTVSTLREVISPLVEVTGYTAPLIELTGQHDNRHLLARSYHLDMLDQFAGTWEQRKEFETLYLKLKTLEKQIHEFENKNSQRQQQIDYLTFQMSELKNFNLAPGDEIQLELQIKEIKASQRIEQFVESADEAITSGDLTLIATLQKLIHKGQELSAQVPKLNEPLQMLEQSKTLLTEASYELRKLLKQTQGSQDSLDDLETQMSTLRKLQKKYGPTVHEILSTKSKIQNELSQLENFDETIKTLKKDLSSQEKLAQQKAKKLHNERIEKAKKLSQEVNKELADLNMKGVKFSVHIEESTILLANGISLVEYTCQVSDKEPFKPLAKTASGGELSRILLSLKKTLGASEYPRTYLFDEVDTGVSGETAEKVGKKLKSIAKNQQVICVTHLPQVAACGDHHYLINKESIHGLSLMKVSELTVKERVQEIARLISGESISKTSLAHAKKLLDLSP